MPCLHCLSYVSLVSERLYLYILENIIGRHTTIPVDLLLLGGDCGCVMATSAYPLSFLSLSLSHGVCLPSILPLTFLLPWCMPVSPITYNPSCSYAMIMPEY